MYFNFLNKKGKTKTFPLFFFFSFIFLISFVSAISPYVQLDNELDFSMPSGQEEIYPVVTTTGSNASTNNVNSSEYWDNLDTPNDISGSQYWYNQSSSFYNWISNFLFNYNQSSPFYTWLSGFNYNYNQSDGYLSDYDYNMTYTDGTYNSTYDKWAYNQTDGIGTGGNESFNQSLTDTLYANIIYGYNMSDGYGNYNYNETTYLLNTYGMYWINDSQWIIDTYGQWFYNMTIESSGGRKGDGNYLYNDTDTMYFNETKLATIYYNATQATAVVGTIDAGNLGNTQHPTGSYDGKTFNFSEKAGAPGLDLRMNFTGIESFNAGVIRYKTSSLAGDYPIIQVWDYDESDWEDYPLLAESENFAIITQPVFDSTDHFSGGVVQMRLYKAANGNTNNHYYVDWVSISKGFGTPAGEEVDPYSYHKNENINATGYNITADYFFGDGSLLDNVGGGNQSFNQTLTDTLYANIIYGYNMSDGYGDYNYNETAYIINTYGMWFYNMSDGFLSNFDYNMTDGYLSEFDYNHSLWIEDTYGQYFYNMSDGIGGGNLTWNETRANELYADILWGYNQTLEDTTYHYNMSDGSYNSTYEQYAYNQTYTEGTYNETYNTWAYNQTIEGGGNQSWNQSLADELYAGIEWDYNQTDGYLSDYDYNMSDGSYNVTYHNKPSVDSNCSSTGSCQGVVYLGYINNGILSLNRTVADLSDTELMNFRFGSNSYIGTSSMKGYIPIYLFDGGAGGSPTTELGRLVFVKTIYTDALGLQVVNGYGTTFDLTPEGDLSVMGNIAGVNGDFSGQVNATEVCTDAGKCLSTTGEAKDNLSQLYDDINATSNQKTNLTSNVRFNSVDINNVGKIETDGANSLNISNKIADADIYINVNNGGTNKSIAWFDANTGRVWSYGDYFYIDDRPSGIEQPTGLTTFSNEDDDYGPIFYLRNYAKSDAQGALFEAQRTYVNCADMTASSQDCYIEWDLQKAGSLTKQMYMTYFGSLYVDVSYLTFSPDIVDYLNTNKDIKGNVNNITKEQVTSNDYLNASLSWANKPNKPWGGLDVYEMDEDNMPLKDKDGKPILRQEAIANNITSQQDMEEKYAKDISAMALWVTKWAEGAREQINDLLNRMTGAESEIDNLQAENTQQQTQIDLLESELCKKDGSYKFCAGGVGL